MNRLEASFAFTGHSDGDTKASHERTAHASQGGGPKLVEAPSAALLPTLAWVETLLCSSDATLARVRP